MANYYEIDNIIYKHCKVVTSYQKIEPIKYTRCDNCNIKLVYDSYKYALYCDNCKLSIYEGIFVIDKAINPGYLHNSYVPMITFDTWVGHLLMYKTNIPANWETKIFEKYDSTSSVIDSKFGDARKFKKILKDMKLSIYNISIANLVKQRTQQQYIPQFDVDDVRLIQSKYDKIIKIVSNLKCDERMKKNQNVMHCKYYIVEIVTKYIPSKHHIRNFVVPGTHDVKRIVNYVWERYLDSENDEQQ